MFEAALRYASHGWHVFPLIPNGKLPLEKGGVNAATVDRVTITGWWGKHPQANIGVALHPSRLVVIDVDHKPDRGVDGRPGFESLQLVYGTPAAVVQTTASGCQHHVCARSFLYGTLDAVHWRHPFAPVDAAGKPLPSGVDVLSDAHRYIVAAPSTINGSAYAWSVPNPWDAVAELPDAWEALTRAEAPRSPRQRAPSDTPADLLHVAALRVAGVELSELDAVLEVLSPECSRDEWLRILWGAAAQWSGSKNELAIVAKLEAWSARTTKAGQYKEGEVSARWNEHTAHSGGRSGAGHITWRSVRAMAREAGWNPFTLAGVNPKTWGTYLQTMQSPDTGKPIILPTAWNASLILAFGAPFKNGIRRNALTKNIELHKPSVAPLRDAARFPTLYDKDSDLVGVRECFKGIFRKPIGAEALKEAVVNAANICTYDPILEWINGLVWDGVPRLDEWLQRTCGADDTPLTRAIGRAWLIGLASRALAEYDGEGVKMDSVLVLQGAEGLGKSTVGSVIGGKWFAEFSSSVNGDDIYYTIEKSLVLEFAELDTMRSSDAGRMKALVTGQVDTFRRKYGAAATSVPRRCVFIGTINDDQFLTRDMTIRRWWLVKCPPRAFNVRWLREHRDQLVAEAKVAYNNGELPILPVSVRPAHAESVEGARLIHPYEEAVATWTARHAPGDDVKMAMAVEEAIGRRLADLSMLELRRFGEVMRACNWAKRHTDEGKAWTLMLKTG